MMQQPKKPASKGPVVDPTHPTDTKKLINTPAQISKIRYSPDGKLLVAACFDATVRRWDAADEPKELPAITGHNGWVTTLAFGPASIPRLYSGDSWGKLIASEVAKPAWSVEAAHDGWLRMLAISPDGNTIVTCGRDRFVRLWAAKDGKKIAEISCDSDPLAVAFAPDGQSFLVGDLHGLVRQYDLATRKPSRTFEVKELYRHDRLQEVGGVRSLTFDAAGKTLAVAGAVPQTGGFVQCTPHIVGFDWATSKRNFTLKGESEKEGYVTDLHFHPTDGYMMLTTSGQPGNGKLLFWKSREEKPYFTAARANAHSLALHPEGKRLAVSATNANSSGNGKPKGKDGDYPANFSPIFFYEMPGTKA